MFPTRPETPSPRPNTTALRGRPVRIAKRMLLATGLTLGFYLVLCLLIAWATVRAQAHRLMRTPHDNGLAYENVAFTSADGIRLSGWFIPANGKATGVVVCCHGVDSTRLSMHSQALILHHAGFAVLLFDFRARGESGGDRCTLGFRETNDLLAAVAYVHSRPDSHKQPIGVLGESMGGAVALMGTARSTDIRCVIAESPFARLDHAVSNHFHTLLGAFGPILGVPTRRMGEALIGTNCADVAPVREIARIAPRPILLIEDADDQLCPPAETQALYAAAKAPKEIWTVPDADHIGAISAQRDEYARRITSFFSTHLPGNR